MARAHHPLPAFHPSLYAANVPATHFMDKGIHPRLNAGEHNYAPTKAAIASFSSSHIDRGTSHAAPRVCLLQKIWRCICALFRT